jgi:hypothetical protein
MRFSGRNIGGAAAVALALAGLPATIQTVQPSGTANADVCASAGRRVTVSGCANLADVMAPFVPEPGYYAPMPDDPMPAVDACVGWNGRWVNADACR